MTTPTPVISRRLASYLLGLFLSVLICGFYLAGRGNAVSSTQSQGATKSLLAASAADDYRSGFEAEFSVLRGNNSFGDLESARDYIEAWSMTDAQSCAMYLSQKRLLSLLDIAGVEPGMRKALDESPSGFLHTVRGLDDAQVRDRLYRAAFKILAEVQPRHALAELSSAPKYLRRQFGFALVNDWAAKHSFDAANAIVSATPSEEEMAIAALDKLVRIDSAEAIKITTEASFTGYRSSKGDILYGALFALAESDYKTAIQLLSSLPASTGRNGVLARAYSTMALKDRDELLRQLKEGHPGLAMLEGVADAVEILAPVDLQKSIELAQLLPGERERGKSYYFFGELMVQRDVEVATRWASSLSEPMVRASAIAGIVDRWFHDDPRTATEYSLRQSNIQWAGAAMRALTWQALREPAESLPKKYSWMKTLDSGSKQSLGAALARSPSPQISNDLLSILRQK